MLAIYEIALELFKVARLLIYLFLRLSKALCFFFFFLDTMQLCRNGLAICVKDRLHFRPHLREWMGKVSVPVGGVLYMTSLVSHRRSKPGNLLIFSQDGIG